MSDLKQILPDMLAKFGWHVETRHTFPCVDTKKTIHRRCCEITGHFDGVDRQAAVCLDTQIVMFFGCGTDYPLTKFLDHLKHGKPEEPKPEPPKPAKARQKSLF